MMPKDCKHTHKIYSAKDGMMEIEWICTQCGDKGHVSTILNLYQQAEERATSYRNILKELVDQCTMRSLVAGPDALMDVVEVAKAMLDEDTSPSIVDMPPGSYSVSVAKVCNPECVNVGTSHDECTGESGVWLPKLLPGHVGEMRCTIHEGDYE